MHARSQGPRSMWRRVHRWVGLVLGVWFAVVGLTGALLVWHSELDAALNPQWFQPGATCAAALPAEPVATALRLQRTASTQAPTQVMAPQAPGAAFVVWSKDAAGARIQHFVDVRCGAYLGRRQWGAARLDGAHAVPLVYEFHRALLAGETGHIVVGVGGIWLLVTVIGGIVLAWPRTSSRPAWKRVFSIKTSAPRPRTYYDAHRAAGMTTAPWLLLMALTGIYLCFPKPFRALLASDVATAPAADARAIHQSALGARAGDEALGPDALVRRAQALWPDALWSRINLPSEAGKPYELRFLQPQEVRKDTGDTRARLAADGDVVELRDPLRAKPGERLLAWLFPLHSGEALGMPGRLAWSVLAVLPFVLMFTGAWLWLNRRRIQRAPAIPAVNPWAPVAQIDAVSLVRANEPIPGCSRE